MKPLACSFQASTKLGANGKVSLRNCEIAALCTPGHKDSRGIETANSPADEGSCGAWRSASPSSWEACSPQLTLFGGSNSSRCEAPFRLAIRAEKQQNHNQIELEWNLLRGCIKFYKLLQQGHKVEWTVERWWKIKNSSTYPTAGKWWRTSTCISQPCLCTCRWCRSTCSAPLTRGSAKIRHSTKMKPVNVQKLHLDYILAETLVLSGCSPSQ